MASPQNHVTLQITVNDARIVASQPRIVEDIDTETAPRNTFSVVNDPDPSVGAETTLRRTLLITLTLSLNTGGLTVPIKMAPPAQSPASNQALGFLHLPREIRDMVYVAFSSCKVSHQTLDRRRNVRQGFLLANKQIYRELEPIYYAIATYCLQLNACPPGCPCRWPHHGYVPDTDQSGLYEVHPDQSKNGLLQLKRPHMWGIRRFKHVTLDFISVFDRSEHTQKMMLEHVARAISRPIRLIPMDGNGERSVVLYLRWSFHKKAGSATFTKDARRQAWFDALGKQGLKHCNCHSFFFRAGDKRCSIIVADVKGL